jgi:uncharacterized protein (DUF1810 family)
MDEPMSSATDLERFLTAQATNYTQALAEIGQGRKRSHWLWYVFPQLAGLGLSQTAQFYTLKDLEEARAYLNHPILGLRLLEITSALLDIQGKTATQIIGSPDDIKLRSSMTLFNLVSPSIPIFQEVLEQYFTGQPDPKTLALLHDQ